MSATSDPPDTNAERRGPVSIMPATENIDDDWGGEPEAGAVGTAEAVAPAKAAAAPPVTSVEVPAPAKVPVIEPTAPAVPATSASPARAAIAIKEATQPATPPPVSPIAAKRSSPAGYLVLGAAVAAAGIWWVTRSPEADHANAAPAAPVASSLSVRSSADPTPAPATAALASESPAASAAPTPLASADPAALPIAASSTAPAASAAPGSSLAPAASSETGETVSVKINITPEGSKLTLKGEEIGKTPMTIELPRGERRVYEVVNKGYYPRRLVIDGTKTEISYGLKPVEAQPAQ